MDLSFIVQSEESRGGDMTGPEKAVELAIAISLVLAAVMVAVAV